jgi:signal transduction histidine kinase
MQAACIEQSGAQSLLDERQRELSRAFASFNQAAGSLERSYGQLQLEVVRLRQQLEMLAHEIRNPLGSLELFAGLLAESDGCTREERAEWITQLQAGLRTLSATVNNVLQVHNQPGPTFVPCDLGEVLDRAFEFLSPLSRQSGVRMEIDNRLRGIVRAADPHRLQQVLLNLALNALRFTPSGGLIELTGSTRRDHGLVIPEIAVRDTGCGITVEHLQKIFEPGFSTRPGSPGLGLAVCRKIVEQHGGEILVSSVPAAGTTFILRFPLP